MVVPQEEGRWRCLSDLQYAYWKIPWDGSNILGGGGILNFQQLRVYNGPDLDLKEKKGANHSFLKH